MWELLTTDVDYRDLTFVIFGFLILSILTNLYFVHNKTVIAAKNRRNTPQRIILKFLSDQSHKSNTVDKHKNRQHLNKHIFSIRHAYLKVEEQSAKHSIDSDSYWNTLNQLLPRIFKNFLKKSPDILSNIENHIASLKERIINNAPDDVAPTTLDNLDRLLKLCKSKAHDTSLLINLSGKISRLSHHFDDVNLSVASDIHNKNDESYQEALEVMDSLGKCHEDNSLVMQRIKKRMQDYSDEFEKEELIKNLNKFQNENQQLKNEIESLKNQLEVSRSQIADRANFILNNGNDETNNNQGEELLDLAEQIQLANEQEIDRLRSTIKSQRSSICHLEDSLRKMEDAKHEKSPRHNLLDVSDDDSDKEVEKLKNTLKESERCITTLENELAEFKQLTNESRLHLANDEMLNPLQDTEEIDKLNLEIQSLSKQLQDSKEKDTISQILVNFTDDALNASSAEDISTLIYQTLLDLKLAPNLIIKGNKREIEITSAKQFDAKTRILINNMPINQLSLDRSHRKLNFRFANIKGNIEALELNDSPASTFQAATKVLRISNNLLNKFCNLQSDRDQKQKIDKCANLLKQVAYDLDKAYDTHLTRTKGQINSGFGQMQDIARSKGLSATHIAGFKSIEQETINELQADSVFRLIIRKKFLELIKQLGAD